MTMEDAYRRGQEDMRERAAREADKRLLCANVYELTENARRIAAAIRALPVETPP